ncbi:MAG: DUF1801 domain-containing protein [Saprospiraceae bacterium]|nr:DUF1801 domain-containing protein [Saprospiraceae bacterium]
MGKNTDVDVYLTKKNHPLTKEIQMVREIILETDDRVEESIKWSSPTFMYKGNIAYFFMNAKKFVSLMFHKGAVLSDEFSLLEGEGKEARVARFENMEDISKKKKALQALINEWIRTQDNISLKL